MSKFAQLFEGQELSDEFVTKATAIMEAELKESTESLQEAHNAKVLELEEQTETRIQEEIIPSMEALTESYIAKELIPNVDKYLTSAVNEWLEENKIAVESGIKVELAETFLTGMVGLVESHSMSVEPEQVELAESLKAEVTKLNTKLNESIDKAIDASKALEEMKKSRIVESVTSELTESQKEKLQKVSEEVSFKTEEQFESAMKDLKESYFPTNKEADEIAAKQTISESTEAVVVVESEENAYLQSFIKSFK